MKRIPHWKAMLGASLLLLAPLQLSHACSFDAGFDSSLGIAHPRAIELALAVQKSVADGVLPRSALEPVQANSAGLWRARAGIQSLHKQLSRASVNAPDVPNFSVLFAESGLWTRFARDDAGYASEFHAAPSSSAEIIVITDETVLREILVGKLSVHNALVQGLILIEAHANKVQAVKDLLTESFEPMATQNSAAVQLDARTPWPSSPR
jgi:hypothetical protein